MDLYVDGNIAQMFSPEDATRYFARFFGIDVRSLRPTASQEPPHPFVITTSATQNACPCLVVNDRPLDYAISQAGTIVPQRMWSPANPADAQHFPNISLNMPIFFLHDDRVTLGLPLLKALKGVRALLQGADDTAPVGSCSTMYIRINWPGYGDWNSQIMTKDQTMARNTVTLEKFVKRVAGAVGRFLDDAERVQGQDSNWRVGTGGITREDVILIGVVHVSQGSWQPILQLDRYVIPRRQHIPGLP